MNVRSRVKRTVGVITVLSAALTQSFGTRRSSKGAAQSTHNDVTVSFGLA